MNSKLLIIVISGLTAIGGAFLFSKNQSVLEPQTANIVEVIAAPAPSKTAVPKIKSTSLTAPQRIPQGPPLGNSLSPSPSAAILPTKTPTLAPTPSATPSESPAPSPSATPIPTTTPTPEPTQTPEPSTKININTADQQELEKITGIGPVIAQRIIEYRQTNGLFQKIEDIKNVKGIGDKTFEKMKNEITI